MRGEQTEAAIEHRGGACRDGLAQCRVDDAALGRPAGMQELRLRAVDPALQQARGEAAGDARGIVHLRCGQAEQPPGEPGRTESGEEPGRMKAAAVELPRRYAADPAGDLIAD